MEIKHKILILSITFLIIVAGCKKDSVIPDGGNDNPDPTGSFQTVGASIVLPEGSTIDLNNATLTSLSEEFSVKNDGTSKVISNTGYRTLAILKDKNDEIILTGFIDSTNAEVSVRSTVISNLYLALGTVFLPVEIKDKFFKEIGTFPDLDKIVEDASKNFATDPNYLFSSDFADVLQEKIMKIQESGSVIDVYEKSIRADGADIRSGIQLREDNSFSFSVINTYRRRAHAFIYKKRIEKEDGSTQNLISDYASEDPGSVSDVKVSSPKAIREVMGVIADWAGGAGMSFAATEAGPVQLGIEDGEKEVLYHCRVIGTSGGGDQRSLMTTKEKEKLNDLVYETFAYELVLPILLDIAGHTEILNGLDETKFEFFVDQLQLIGSSISSVEEPLQKGEYKKALEEFMISYYNNTLGGKAPDLIKILLDNVAAAGVQLSPDYFVQNSSKAAIISDGFAKYLKRTDLFLKIADYTRILYANAHSNYLEQWDVTAKKDEIVLTPEEAVIVRGKYVDFEVLKEPTPNDGAVLQYEWSTTGKYGVISDNASHIDQVAFTSSKDKISYVTTVSEDELSDGDNLEEITVKVSVKQGNTITEIGSDTSVINIKKFEYKIKPDGLTVQGGNTVKLKIERSDGVPLTDSEGFESKVIWTTEGLYGLFDGTTSSITQEKTGSYSVNYKALDKDVEKAEEQISATVYRKETNDEDWILYDKVTGKVKIENEENVVYKYVSVSLDEEPPHENDNGNCHSSIKTVWYVPVVENAKSYTVTVMEYTPHSSAVDVGDTYSWTVGASNEPDIGEEADGQSGETKSVYKIYSGSYYAGSGIGPCKDSASESYAKAMAYFSAVQSYVMVRIVLKPD